MASGGEGDTPMVEQPVEEPKAVVKEKKPKAPKEKKPKTASHPPYFQMIKEALVGLNEKGGSSPYAIAKYMEDKHKSVLPGNFRKILALQLKNQAARGTLIKIKASYKLSSSEGGKKESIRVSRRSTRAQKAKATKKTEGAKKVGVKKTRKSSSAAKPKQPKSIRTPSKRARKATASAS
ncbi:histone H1 [Senna tora]|uniref:Histone H1 n=1 Tax=Senna tora TaxID=362788 RepID=A0A834TUU2_9FABA|nr:histone H1 [Senna tora]